MIPNTNKEKDKMLCPICDGEGKVNIGQEGIPITCSECNGSGYLPIIKTK
jgi:DnaJ-class molecular chaperone